MSNKQNDIYEETKKQSLEEVRLASDCCGTDVDFTGGGYEDEYIHPIVEICKKCGMRCTYKRIVPPGYKELEVPF